MGFDASPLLAATALNSMAIQEGKSNTLFFRFYISPTVDLAFPGGGIPEIDINLGLTEKGLRDVQDFRGGNNGPSLRIYRQGLGSGGPIDLRSPNGVGAAGGTYSYIADTVNNPTGAGLEPGKVYTVWMDVQNRPFDVVGGVQNGGDLYSLYLQKEGEPARVNLFESYLSDRDAVTCDAILGCPIPPLTHLFFCANDQVTPQGTNTVRFDDFFLSTDGYSATIPIVPSSFLGAQDALGVAAFEYDVPNALIRMSWNNTKAGSRYTVLAKERLDDQWTEVITDYPPDGAATTTVTFETVPFGPTASFFAVLLQP
jgi:hypothetical protein